MGQYRYVRSSALVGNRTLDDPYKPSFPVIEPNAFDLSVRLARLLLDHISRPELRRYAR